MSHKKFTGVSVDVMINLWHNEHFYSLEGANKLQYMLLNYYASCSMVCLLWHLLHAMKAGNMMLIN